MAMTVFCLLFIPVFPAVSRAAENVVLARSGYTAHLQAQEIMLIVKDAVVSGHDPQPLVIAYASTWITPMEYGYWLSGGGSFVSAGAPNMTVTLTAPGGSVVVTAVVWDSTGKPVGRAVGMINN
jgi:hypothetical protein